jgi:hypothetical protein
MIEKMAAAIGVATGIMLATSGSAASVLAQQYTAPGEELLVVVPVLQQG